jgi:predicted AlkP superfamily phosphohydrolase/phosphomutase
MANGSSPARVLVIGLDMGDGVLIRHWTRSGRLPHLATLMSSGAWVDIESTAEVLHTSTWPTFATGTLPGRHGVYYPYQPKPGFQLAQHIENDQYGTSTFWTLASAAGRRSVVYDVPETFPDPQFQGRAVFDWGTWAWYGEPSSQPAGLLKELKWRFGPYSLGLEAKQLGLRWPNDIERRLLEAVRYKQLTAQWLLESWDWDLAVVGFCETHPAGHYLWPSGVDSIESADEKLFQPLFHVYAAVDKAVAALSASVPDDVILVVTSGDGVRPNRCAWHLLPAVLERLGYTSSGNAAGGGDSPSSRGMARRGPLVPAAARRLIANSLPWRVRDRLGVWLQTRRMDWSRTRAFTLPTDLEGCIRINLKGREPYGVVEPGAQYHDLCQEIRGHLEELVNPTTGRRAVRHVFVRHETYAGLREEALPDLIVTWNDDAAFSAVNSPRVGSIQGVNPDPRPGTHAPYGFVLAGGPGIPRCQGRGHLADVAPTVLRLLGLTDMQGFDGAPLEVLTRGIAAVSTMSRPMETR